VTEVELLDLPLGGTASIAWGDATAPQAVPIAAADPLVVTHTYAAAATYTIVVTVRLANGTFWGRGQATVTAVAAPPPAPTVSAIAPDTGPEAGSTPASVTGTGLTDATDVTFDGVPSLALVHTDDTMLGVVSPPGTAGPVDVVVHHPAGDVTLTDGFTYT
jgi:PKD repeat protein